MVIDSLANAQKYAALHPLFAKAFEYIRTTDLASLETGKFEIDGDNLKGSVSYKTGMTTEESIAKFECHNKHIDIQVCISGHETIGWKPRETCTQQRGEYNEEKDVVFYNDTPDMYFALGAGQFGIFYPEDVHAPMIGNDNIKKLVIKVKI
ncbi:YhcH/YjgK/YiaL family protein [Sediminibacterium ginsengisoli]|uniref:YhcH/YjgK/YiaL family protein n=1 Tax=Sediminibacterium ginsengisoli TaxID=413434 RepID=A0A1T4K3Z4_9BACT|nr:YhcH/YjgK/YiaL family protein [Sediminibacterium ginsengisoli]SJZ37063.1 YhcH/YjgK/YiaL family protein [Sediminibacterium ginsengisoli]